MPYLDKRKETVKHIDMLIGNCLKKIDAKAFSLIGNEQGQYSLSALVNRLVTFIAFHYIKKEDINYDQVKEIYSGVHLAGQEILRRILFPYEDLKIKTNGDIEEMGSRIAYEVNTKPILEEQITPQDIVFPIDPRLQALLRKVEKLEEKVEKQ